MTAPVISRVTLAGLPLHSAGFEAMATWIVERCLCPENLQPAIIAHINIHNMYLLIREPRFADRLREETNLIFDGIALKLAVFIAGAGWHRDLNGTDLFPLVMRHAEERAMRLFFLGADAETIRRTAEIVAMRYPRAAVVGFHHGYFTPSEESCIIDLINRSNADLLVVGMGFVRQEQFSLTHRGALRVKGIWNVGGLFDFLSGKKPRTPVWMRTLRLEWLFRCLLEPKRMWKRSIISAPLLLSRVLIRRISGQAGMSEPL